MIMSWYTRNLSTERFNNFNFLRGYVIFTSQTLLFSLSAWRDENKTENNSMGEDWNWYKRVFNHFIASSLLDHFLFTSDQNLHQTQPCDFVLPASQLQWMQI